MYRGQQALYRFFRSIAVISNRFVLCKNSELSVCKAFDSHQTMKKIRNYWQLLKIFLWNAHKVRIFTIYAQRTNKKCAFFNHCLPCTTTSKRNENLQRRCYRWKAQKLQCSDLAIPVLTTPFLSSHRSRFILTFTQKSYLDALSFLRSAPHTPRPHSYISSR